MLRDGRLNEGQRSGRGVYDEWDGNDKELTLQYRFHHHHHLVDRLPPPPDFERRCLLYPRLTACAGPETRSAQCSHATSQP